MKKKIKFLLGSFIIMLCLSACGKQVDVSTEKPSTEQEVSQSETAQPEGFDIEVARKNIIIKGQPFEIPVALGDLKDGWTWKEHYSSSVGTDGAGGADLFYHGEEWFSAGIENYYEGAEDQGIVYNIAIKTDDCSIDGIVPYQTTKQEVLDKYGKPDEIVENSGVIRFRYGTTNNNSEPLGPIKEQQITIRFDENDTVVLVSITYADLTEEE